MEQLIAKLSDFKSTNMLALRVDLQSQTWDPTNKKLDLVLFLNPDKTISALENRCSHADIELSGGFFEEGEIECPAHGAKFDVKTGKNLCMPAVKPVKAFAVRLEGDNIYLTT